MDDEAEAMGLTQFLQPEAGTTSVVGKEDSQRVLWTVAPRKWLNYGLTPEGVGWQRQLTGLVLFSTHCFLFFFTEALV